MAIPPQVGLCARRVVRTAFRSTLAVAAIGIAATAGAQTVRLPPVERIDAVYARYDSDSTPGCAVTVLHADSVIFSKAYGMAHIGFKVPMTTATTTWIPYSESRTFVALAAATLARDGALTLDDPVRRHVPELPAYASAVTVRHLLHHTSGLADYGSLDIAFDLTDRISDDQMFRALERWGSLNFPAGRGHMYSNTDYAVLRILVERVSTRSLHDYLHEQLLDRLGMRNTWLGVEQQKVPGAHALFHDGEWRPVLRYRISPVGRISVSTSVDDLTKWARALRDSSSGIRPLLASLERGASDTADTYGSAYGIATREDAGLALEEFRGVEGYRYITRAPAHDLSVVTMCNHYGAVVAEGPRIAALFVPGVDTTTVRTPLKAAAPSAPRPTISVTMPELQRFVGEYRTIDDKVTGVRVELVDSALVITVGDGRRFPTRSVGSGLFAMIIAGNERSHSRFDIVNGEVLLSERDVDTGAPVGKPIRRYVGLKPSPATLQGYLGAYEGEKVEGTLYVTVHGDSLMIAARGHAPILLHPNAEVDAFRVPDYVLRFTRDRAGRVTHLTLDATRVQGMRYARKRQ